ncbi:MAG: hypothetical protein HY301_04010 [Verrucomicrobia bacterium]|nr:hypothetical protein [Verrucomicrobiota bacterium]
MPILAHGDPRYLMLLPVVLFVWAALAAVIIYLVYRFFLGIYENRLRSRFLKLHPHLAQKISTFPESSFGEYRVTLVLSDSRTISNVVVSAGALYKVDGRKVCRRTDVDFRIEDIVDVDA